jgi:hypothetical protein
MFAKSLHITDCCGKVLRKMPQAGSYHTTPRQTLIGMAEEICHAFPDLTMALFP